jgi:hypothetical protein
MDQWGVVATSDFPVYCADKSYQIGALGEDKDELVETQNAAKKTDTAR